MPLKDVVSANSFSTANLSSFFDFFSSFSFMFLPLLFNYNNEFFLIYCKTGISIDTWKSRSGITIVTLVIPWSYTVASLQSDTLSYPFQTTSSPQS